VRQVIANLAGNAIKFTPAGVVGVEVRAASVPADTGRLRLEVVVRDTGIGISRARQQTIFGAFEQADPSLARRFGGSGLGLTISRRLVALMGGELRADSVPGQGSAFQFTLVVDVPPGAPSLVDVYRRRLAGTRVLIIDDHAGARQALADMLGACGVAATVAERGAAAVRAIRAESARPFDALVLDLPARDADALRGPFDVVFMHVQRPDGDGFEATAAIRTREAGTSRRIPIVALTAQRDDRARCLAAGMDDYLSKPVAPAELADMLERVALPQRGGHA
jgi:CheY-like chemotaxis protein